MTLAEFEPALSQRQNMHTSHTCRALQCGARATRFGHFCNSHTARRRRHGAPDQRTITKTLLDPFTNRVRARVKANEGNPAWEHCEASWRALVSHAEGIVAHSRTGAAGIGFERSAAEELCKLARAIDPQDIMFTVFAMFLMAEERPGSFVSDEGFSFQLVRRVRGLTDANAGEWFDHNSGRVKRAYRDVPPKVTRLLASWLSQAFGGIAIYFARLDQRDREEKQRRTDALATALASLR